MINKDKARTEKKKKINSEQKKLRKIYKRIIKYTNPRNRGRKKVKEFKTRRKERKEIDINMIVILITYELPSVYYQYITMYIPTDSIQ